MNHVHKICVAASTFCCFLTSPRASVLDASPCVKFCKSCCDTRWEPRWAKNSIALRFPTMELNNIPKKAQRMVFPVIGLGDSMLYWLWLRLFWFAIMWEIAHCRVGLKSFSALCAHVLQEIHQTSRSNTQDSFMLIVLQLRSFTPSTKAVSNLSVDLRLPRSQTA